MIECFLADVDNLLREIRAALDAGNLGEVGRLGHRLKGTVVYLGAKPAEEAACRVEQCGKANAGAASRESRRRDRAASASP